MGRYDYANGVMADPDMARFFLDDWLSVHEAQPESIMERMFPLVEIPISNSESTMPVQDSMLARVLKANGGSFEEVCDQYLENAGTGKLADVEIALNYLTSMNGKKTIFPGKIRKDVHTGKKYLPTIDKAIPSAIKKAFGISLNKLVIVKGMIQVRSSAELLEWVNTHVYKVLRGMYSASAAKKQLAIVVRMLDRRVVFITPDTLKSDLGTKLYKVGKYFKTPLQDVSVKGVEFFILPNEVDMDGCGLTNRHLDKGMNISVDTFKFIGIGSWDKKSSSISVDIHLHNTVDAYLKSEYARASLSFLTRARWNDIRKPLSWLDGRSYEYAEAVATGDHRLGDFVMAGGVAPDEGEEHVKFSKTLKGVMGALREVDSVKFGSMLPKVESMLYPLIRNMICRGKLDGRMCQIVVDHSLGMRGDLHEIILPVDFEGDGYSVDNKGIAVRYPGFPDTIVSTVVAGKKGNAIRISPALARLLGGDFDGDALLWLPEHTFGLVKNIPWRTEDDTVPDWITYEDNPDFAKALVRDHGVTKSVAATLVQMAVIGEGMDSRLIGRATQTFRRLSEGFIRLGRFYDEDVQLFLRGVKSHFLQGFLDGIKHSVRMIDFNASLKAAVQEAKKIDSNFDFRARSLTHMIASASFPMRTIGKNRVAIISTGHPLYEGLAGLGVIKGAVSGEGDLLEWEGYMDTTSEDEDIDMILDVNKLIPQMFLNKKIDMSDPFLAKIFDRLSGMKLGSPPNRIHEAAREIVKNDPLMIRVARRIGIRPEWGTQYAPVFIDGVLRKDVRSMICQVMDTWGTDIRHHANMETSQQNADGLLRYGAEYFAKEFEVSVEMMQVLITICIFSYTSSMNKGMYGGLFAYDPRIIAAARMLVDGSWAEWMEQRQLEEEATIRKEEEKLGLTPGTIGRVIDTTWACWNDTWKHK